MTRIFALLLAAAAMLSAAPVPKQVLAFYYGWYGNPRVSGKWVHWRDVDESKKHIASSMGYPLLGAYDSHDPEIVDRHCREAKQAGLTGFIATWWSPGDFHDQGMPLLLEKAGKYGLKVTIYFETVPPKDAPTPAGAAKNVLYVLERYGGNAAWLKVNGKPVVFVYGRAVGQLKLDGWAQAIAEVNRTYRGGAVFIGDQISGRAAQVFDGIHTYNITGKTKGMSLEQIRAWAKTTYPEWVKTAGQGISCLTIIPGYDDSQADRPKPRPITDRHDGKTYRALWEEAIAAKPNWILITTFNEWHEGSFIEPSVEYGDRELKATRDYAPRFLR